MRLGISNIAWDPIEDAAVAELLRQHAVDAIDIAPGKYFPNPAAAGPVEIERVARTWRARGIEIVGMQALLFGTQGLNVFGDDASQAAMLAHLDGICRIGAGTGARRLVFGSPRNRDRSGLDDEQARRVATDFFRRLGDIAASHDVLVCLEPNPPHYAANFMTTGAETAQVVRLIDHPHIRMQFDSGAFTLSGEDPEALLSRHADLICHVHASEPDLVPLGDGDTNHAACRAALEKYLPTLSVCIEMVATRDEDHLASIDRALVAADRHYRMPREAA